jgi:hypothetical protein
MAGSVSMSLVGALGCLAISAAGAVPCHAQERSPAASPGVRPAVGEGRAVAPACGARSEDRVEQVERDGEVRLASGRRVRLLDLRFPDDQVARDRAVLALGSTVGGRVLADIVGSVDRWGRHAGRLALIEGSGPVDLAELLVGEGLALSMWASATGSAPPGSSRSKRRRVVAARGSGRARARPLSRRPTRSGLPGWQGGSRSWRAVCAASANGPVGPTSISGLSARGVHGHDSVPGAGGLRRADRRAARPHGSAAGHRRIAPRPDDRARLARYAGGHAARACAAVSSRSPRRARRENARASPGVR